MYINHRITTDINYLYYFFFIINIKMTSVQMKTAVAHTCQDQCYFLHDEVNVYELHQDCWCVICVDAMLPYAHNLALLALISRDNEIHSPLCLELPVHCQGLTYVANASTHSATMSHAVVGSMHVLILAMSCTAVPLAHQPVLLTQTHFAQSTAVRLAKH